MDGTCRFLKWSDYATDQRCGEPSDYAEGDGAACVDVRVFGRTRSGGCEGGAGGGGGNKGDDSRRTHDDWLM